MSGIKPRSAVMQSVGWSLYLLSYPASKFFCYDL